MCALFDDRQSHSDLFELSQKDATQAQQPLAHRMRPQELHDLKGQERILGPQTPLRQWIESDRVPSLILWGPPGCGKTSLANVIAHKTLSDFKALSAILSGVKEIKEAVANAKLNYKLNQRKTILFVDEIHRFNKSQQDALLPHVEDGTVTLIGATTENPSFEINSALLSRSRVIRLERLSVEAISHAIEHALVDSKSGLGGRLALTAEAMIWLAQTADGDARRALTTLEAVALSVQKLSSKSEEPDPLSVAQIQSILASALENQPIFYDKKGDEHYNVISAFIKSMRDSDPDAALYYLARMLEGGEDPLFIARRLVVFASEDVGNADPRALMVALSVKEAVAFVGMPEARINLAQGVSYLSVAPKSNASYQGLESALEEVKRSGALPVPLHLRNAVTSLMKAEGYGAGYRYPHSSPAPATKQCHLPRELENKKFYFPKDSGLEKAIQAKLSNR